MFEITLITLKYHLNIWTVLIILSLNLNNNVCWFPLAKTKSKWKVTSADTYFHTFFLLVFPRTAGPFLFLTDIHRHLWELSHGVSSSVRGSHVSMTAALPAAMSWRGNRRRFSQSCYARKEWQSITLTPVSIFPHYPLGSQALTVQAHTTRPPHHPHKHLNELRLYRLVTTSNSISAILTCSFFMSCILGVSLGQLSFINNIPWLILISGFQTCGWDLPSSPK